LECGANRFPAGDPIRGQGRRAQSRPAALGSVPFWAKALKVGFANINAKAEGIATRPAFREASQRRRCPVPVDSFLRME
jgi:putative SOS response-associated peptidase YedK